MHCGFAIREVLGAVPLDGNPRNADRGNLAVLCPTCRRMHELGIIPTDVIVRMRARQRLVTWQREHAEEAPVNAEPAPPPRRKRSRRRKRR